MMLTTIEITVYIESRLMMFCILNCSTLRGAEETKINEWSWWWPGSGEMGDMSQVVILRGEQGWCVTASLEHHVTMVSWSGVSWEAPALVFLCQYPDLSSVCAEQCADTVWETGENTDNTSDMSSSGDDETVEHELQCLLNVEMWQWVVNIILHMRTLLSMLTIIHSHINTVPQ